MFGFMKKLIDKLTNKSLDEIIEKYWLPITIIIGGCLSIIEGWLLWLADLPWIYKLPLLCAIPVLALIGVAIVNAIKDIWGFTKRTKAIKCGAKIIFEDKDSLWILNVTEGWAASAAEPTFFSMEENRLRIRNAYLNQKVRLIEADLTNKNPTDPVSYMIITKVEFVRWLVGNPDILIPKVWYG
jgi:hypothetical protein